MLPEISPEELRKALEYTVENLLWEADLAAPPIDAYVVAKQLNLRLTHDPSMAQRAKIVQLAGYPSSRHLTPTVILRPDKRLERNHWALAHEIGEYVAHQVFTLLDIHYSEIPTGSRETVANYLASTLLLPGEWFRVDGEKCDWDLFELKEIYATASHELIARRMLEMPKPIVVTLFDQGRSVWRRSNTLHQVPALSPLEKTLWQQSHQQAEVTFSDQTSSEFGLSEIRCWPIHEPHWRREIIRSEIAEMW